MKNNDMKNSLITGSIIILVGAGILLSQFTDFNFERWWIGFMLIPALIMFGSAFNSQGRNRLWAIIGGLGIVFAACGILFNFSGSMWLGASLIFGGVCAILPGFSTEKSL